MECGKSMEVQNIISGQSNLKYMQKRSAEKRPQNTRVPEVEEPFRNGRQDCQIYSSNIHDEDKLQKTVSANMPRRMRLTTFSFSLCLYETRI